MPKRLPLVVLLALSTAACSSEQALDTTRMPPNFAVLPIEQDANWAREWWMPRHEQKIADAENADIDLLMLGDSITQGWEGPGAAVWDKYYGDRNAFNIGFGGDRTEHVLWRLQHGAVDNMAPKLVVLMLGTNNTGHRMDPASYVAEGMEMIVDELRTRLPESRILVLGIFPRHISPYNDFRERNEEINTLLAGLADGETVYYLDVNDAFLAEDGTLQPELMPDLLHPNAEGYEAWAAAMEPTISNLLR